MNIQEELLDISTYSRTGRKIRQVRALVMHWTAAPGQTPEMVRHYYESNEAVQQHYGSSHYIVGTDGAILRIIPEDEVALHVGSEIVDPVSKRIYTDFARSLFPEVVDPVNWSPNPFCLGVEMCVTDWSGKFTEETLASAADLAKDILSRYIGIVVTTHHDIVGWKDCPRWWVNHPEEFDAFKARLVPPSGVMGEKIGV